MQVKGYHFFILLAFISPPSLAADYMADENNPSLDFLEYLGELETEVNGEIINPIELDLVANNANGEETNDE